MPLSKDDLEQLRLDFQQKSQSRPFMSIKPPTRTEGYEYRVRFLGEIRKLTPRTGQNAGKPQDVVDVQYLSKESGDPEFETGKEYTLNIRNVFLLDKAQDAG